MANKHKFLLVSLLCFIYLSSFAQVESVQYNYKFYTYIGASATLWTKPEQPLMTLYHRPVHIFFDIGPHKSFWSVRPEMSLHETFKQDFVLLTNFFLSINLELNSSKLLHKPYGGFIFAGPNIWYSILTFDGYIYREDDKGYGFSTGSGLYYDFGKTRLSAYFIWQCSGKGAWFYAGNIHLQNVGTGSYNIMLSISYNLF